MIAFFISEVESTDGANLRCPPGCDGDCGCQGRCGCKGMCGS